MSNTQAIATITAALKLRLQGVINAAQIGGSVSTRRPDGKEQGPHSAAINVFLYEVVPNAAWRNADLPTRRADGTLARRPQVALDLHYLISFYGDEEKLEPQRLLGGTVSMLHAQPSLTSEQIELAQRQYPSDLSAQIEAIRFVPLALNLEELSKLWSVLFQTPYALSVAYQASVVLIEAELTPQPALPAAQRGIYDFGMNQPVIEQLGAYPDPDAPLVVGATLRIVGRRLRGADLRMRIGGCAAFAPPVLVSDTELRQALDPQAFPWRALCAGVRGVQVVQQRRLGASPEPHTLAASNSAPFVLRPALAAQPRVLNPQPLAGDLRQAQLELRLRSPVEREQQVLLLLNEASPPPERAAHAYAVAAPPHNGLTNPGAAVARAQAQAAAYAGPEQAAAQAVAAAVEAAAARPAATFAALQAAALQAAEQAGAGATSDDERAAMHAAALDTADALVRTDTLTFNLGSIHAGIYLARVQVDGAASVLQRAANGAFSDPQAEVVIP